MPENTDPFREVREILGVLPYEFLEETIPMFLRHKDACAAAKD
mgnify:FL=1